ncbi:hypothetical protein ACQJBY_053336 [Aegilops geniculata]
MDDSMGWDGLIEALAFGDFVLLAKIKEIASWYDNNRAWFCRPESCSGYHGVRARDRMKADYSGDTRVSATEVLLWCMSEAHGWDWDLTHKYEDYRSVCH